MSHPDKEYLEKYLQPLVGATVEKVAANDEDYQAWPVITVRTLQGETWDLEISADEEGNGPGFVHGLPRPNWKEA